MLEIVALISSTAECGHLYTAVQPTRRPMSTRVRPLVRPSRS